MLRVVTGGGDQPSADAGSPAPRTAADLALPLDFDEVLDRYSSYVATVGLRLLGRDTEVDDLVQDVFFRVFRGLGRLRDPRALRAWIGRITVHEARRRLRRRMLRRVFVAEDPCDYERLADDAATPEERALAAAAYRLLDHLPAETRIAWVLREVEGEQLDRVAELCGCSVSTVQRRLRAARAVMDEMVSDG